MGKTLEKIKGIARNIAIIGLFSTPYVALNSIESQIYAIKEGKREYLECAALRTIDARKSAIELQNKIINYIK